MAFPAPQPNSFWRQRCLDFRLKHKHFIGAFYDIKILSLKIRDGGAIFLDLKPASMLAWRHGSCDYVFECFGGSRHSEAKAGM